MKTKTEKIILFILIALVFLLAIIIGSYQAKADPMIAYGKEVNKTRAKMLLNQFNSSCFKDITVIYFWNRGLGGFDDYRYYGYFFYKGKTKAIYVLHFSEMNDEETIYILNHELGHNYQFKNGFRVTGSTKFNETFAENYKCGG